MFKRCITAALAASLMMSVAAAPGIAASGVNVGVSGQASVGLGLGANVLLGGSNDQIALQPASIEGVQGLNVAAGFGEMTLTAAK